ncbi:two component transcriptional regulator, winged helix family [Alkaliphilus metalliredigens QYMF]|uniref:Stage 0 sporulation protein A homolog n=1 Tax=Alkaliphilus metalliredigens (strain QYMF) TaxID=293826 RepID=A6TPN8_ALKMQ|nr:response regulator transcription factor [Alkaliphilus metalliredigens]ABR48156.1 two component transcriptional regulator, winged helix family [Alkaliphilus metalliredigens QYMF]
MRILIIEDEIPLAEALSQMLKKNNYTVDLLHDGESGLDYALSDIYDLILLDIMLPKMDGLSILKEIRQEGIATPVILLTAKGEITDKVMGLDSGADDYLAKPFATEELLARIRAISRRKGEVILDGTLKYGDVQLNPSTLKLSKESKEVKLTLKESDLLAFLILRNNLASSKELIIEKIWGFDSDVEHNHVEVYISFLRKKLLFLTSKVVINTLRGVGYILEVKS